MPTSPRPAAVLSALLLLACPAPAAPPPVRPAALKPGDTIMMVAPAGALDETRITLAIKRLRAMGFKVIVPDDLLRSRGYLAGTDRQRADELMRAFRDPEVDAIFPGTGGYGVTRMLDLLDWDAIAANPKIVVGFSDITALHLALAAKTGLVTFHSPVPEYGLGSEENLTPFSAKYFWRCLLASENNGARGFVYADQPESVGPIKRIAGGRAVGPVTGGNLTLIAATMGTPYEINTDGAILFLEDVGEAPYRIDRMLSQLKLGGKLDTLAGVVLGQFNKCDDKDGDGLSLEQVFLDYFAEAPYPVVSNFAAGHVDEKATLPLGVPCRLDADALTFEVLENPVTVE